MSISNEIMKKEANAAALLPIIVFLIFYLGSGLYFEYIKPVDGGMGFYVMSPVVAFMFGLVVAFIQNKNLDFNQKITVCAKSIGDDNITTMLFIFLLAGAFGGIAESAGGAASAANLLLSIIPSHFAIVGLFVIACVISMAMGTSCGTISVVVPVAMNVAAGADLNLPLCIASVVGGAMFGDNLSFISDTTIAATKTQGCKMKDKFRENFPIALPAAIATIIILMIVSLKFGGTSVGSFDYNIWQAIPYFGILVIALCGINVFVVLGTGIVAYFIVGLATGAANVADSFSAMGTGTSGMYETMIVTILVASMSGLIRENGGFESILQFIKRTFKGKRGGQAGVALLTSVMDVATANNTVAIVAAGPIAKDVSKEFDITPQRTASIMDIFSCVWQGIIPYGAQLLIASGLAGISSLSIIPFLFYQFLLFISAILFIIFKK